MRFAEQMAKLSGEQRLHFYELLAENLTVAIRGIWSNESISDAENVDRIKWVNELLHRVTAKVSVLRLKTHEWTEEDFGSLTRDIVSQSECIKGEVILAVKRSYQVVTSEEMR